jgi:hypothetical protein
MCGVAKVRQLNDAFRTSLTGGRVLITQGVSTLPNVDEVMRRVREFDDFNEDNDPHGERDFGSFMQGDQNIFWKLDYYSTDLQEGSSNPADSTVTTRVLTVMLASEY